MTGEELINKLIAIVEGYLPDVEKKLCHLSDAQLNWKPTLEIWSLNEIFAHLNEYANFYHNSFDSKISKTKFRTPSQNFVSSPLGRAAWKSMKLGNMQNVKRKFKAASSLNPSTNSNLIKGRDFELFLKQQKDLLAILEKAKTINIRKAKVSISISKIIKFRLGDAFSFVIYHNERHIYQALNLMSNPNFPKKK